MQEVQRSSEAQAASLTAGASEGAWSRAVEPDAAVELVMAVVKGVQLAPDAARAAFAQLDALLTGEGRG